MAKVKTLSLPEFIAAERGNAAHLAAELGVHKTQITNWAKGRAPIAPHRCVAIENATGGIVPRQKLRSDWREIWPELAQPCKCAKTHKA
jgi:DNA-binding transcriptional regulator YdaS (Cro superfamily)